MKERIFQATGYPMKEQMLSYKNVWLSNNVELSQYGIFEDKRSEFPSRIA